MRSKWTPEKQKDLYEIFKKEVCAGNAALTKVERKYPGWADEAFWVFDLNAGPGIYEDGSLGSPILLLEVLIRYTERVSHLILCENNADRKDNFWRLSKALSHRNIPKRISVSPLNMDQQQALPLFYANTRKKRFGLCYQDFSGCPDFKLLGEFSQVACYAKTDILINCNTTAIKRIRGVRRNKPNWNIQKETRLPEEAIKDIDKRYWQVRRPLGKWQWQMFLGTNWPAMQTFKHLGFERLENGES